MMNARFLLSRPPCLFSLIFLSLFPLVSPLHAEGNDQADVFSGWRKAKETFDIFIREPSSITAREFYDSIPADKNVALDKEDVLNYIFRSNRDDIIAIEMLQGNIYAARAAIRIIKFVRGEWQQRVGESLGELIRVNPAVFLRACYEEREDPYIKEKGFPVNYIPVILHMKKTMVSYEMEMRREALRSVEDPELRLVRDECLDTIEKGTQLFETYASDRPNLEEHEERRLGEPGETVKNVLLEMKSRPSSENMKKVLALFDDRGEEFNYVIPAVFPLVSLPGEGWPPRQSRPDPLEIILHEARCGNEYAIEVSFSALLYAVRYWDDLAAQLFYDLISNLILIKPAVFIEKVAKYRYLEAERPDTMPINMDPVNFLDMICSYVDGHSYQSREAMDVILRRRIASLAALNMPEQKELIDRCIHFIEKKLR